MARTQRNFLLAVTHELRTPIAAIKLQLQTLAREGLRPDQQATLRATAVTEADRLSLLTDKVLMATRADDDVLPLELAMVDVVGTMTGVIDRARTHIARDHHIRLIGPDLLVVNCDEQALRSIADNLVENAAKYAPPDPRSPCPWMINVINGDFWSAMRGPGYRVLSNSASSRSSIGGSEETRSAKGTGLGFFVYR